MKYSKIFIDISNLYARGFSVTNWMTSDLDDGTSIITGGIFTSVKMIQRIEKQFLSSMGEIFFVFDNVHSGDNRRKLIDPDYKKNRKKKYDSYYRGLDILHHLLLNYKDNYVTIKRPGSEADDLISPLVREYDSDNILLVSNDMDWFRSIGENVHVAKYENKDYVIYDQEKFFDKFGFYPTPERVCLYKAFRGDGSDDIPKGVPGIREASLVKLVTNYNSLNNIFKDLHTLEFLGETWKAKIEENKTRLRMNMKLVTSEEVSFQELKDYMFFSSYNPRTLKSLYKSLGFKISSFDSRVMSLFPDKKEDSSFFEYDVLPRE